MPLEISYQTKIIGLRSVTLRGKLDWFDIGGWSIKTTTAKEWESISEWLEKFDGKEIKIEITLIDFDTDDHLLGDHVDEEYDELIEE